MTFPLTFLSASDGTRLTKNIDTGISYPLVYQFNSSSTTVKSLRGFLNILKIKAKESACLLKGEILTTLKNRPRKGSTSPYTETNWICLDIDGLNVKDERELLDLIPELKDKAYIRQDSASQGVKSGLRCHLFFLLDKPKTPSDIKLWLTNINMSFCMTGITLNKAGTALKYPVDITVCQNDKLIYIAPPISATPDPIKKRIRLVGTNKPQFVDLLTADLSPEKIKADKARLKTELRKAAGLPSKKDKMKDDILLNPPEANVTGCKQERDYVYLNLNGGDSWGYYFPVDNPEIVYNFKSEPNFYLKDIAPEWYAKFILPDSKDTRTIEQAQKKGKYWLAFNDEQTDQYYIGYYDQDTQESNIHPTRNKAKVADFLKEHGQPARDFIPTWRYETRFDSDTEFDPDKKFINKFKRSNFLKHPVNSGSIPPLTSKLLEHTFGKSKDHFINWVACICQKRIRTSTAWVLGGVQGSGKSIITMTLLEPLLGKKYVRTLNPDSMESNFNSYADALLVMVEEAQISSSKNINKLVNRIKHYITEKHIDINKKFISEYQIENHMNFIFTGNQYDITQIDPDDRRYNVPARQEKKLLGNILTKKEIEVGIKAELFEFAGYLLNYSIDIERAGTVIHTEEKTRLQDLTRDSNQQIVDALKAGNLQFFYDNRPESEDMLQFELATRIKHCISYDEMLNIIAKTAGLSLQESKPIHIPNNWLRLIFFHIGDQHIRTAHKFTKFLNHKGLNPKPISFQGASTRGLYGWCFIADDILKSKIKNLKKSTNVVNISS